MLGAEWAEGHVAHAFVLSRVAGHLDGRNGSDALEGWTRCLKADVVKPYSLVSSDMA